MAPKTRFRKDITEKEGNVRQTQPKKIDADWWCECDCALCEIGDHGHCTDPRCGRPKTYDKKEKRALSPASFFSCVIAFAPIGEIGT